MTDKGGDDSASTTTVRTIVAVSLLVAFGVLVAILMFDANNASEVVWSRRVYLLGGVEAIVFASVGWMFGREVHRSEAESAKVDAEEAKEKAEVADKQARDKTEEAAVERTKGQAVKAAARSLLADSQGSRETAGARPVGLQPGTSTVAPGMSILAMVDELWPD